MTDCRPEEPTITQNISEGLKIYSENVGGAWSENSIESLIVLLQHRRELIEDNLCSPRPQKNISNILCEIASTKLFAESVRRYHGHIYLEGVSQYSESIYIKDRTYLTLSNNLKLDIGFESAQWEGLVGITFYAIEENIRVPLFIVRGNPFNNGEEAFHIRAVQPWVSESIPSIKSTKEIAKSTDDIKMALLLSERERLLGRVMKALNMGTNLYSEEGSLHKEEIFLLLTLSFLGSRGVGLARGISHEAHPRVIRNKNDGMVVNYDELHLKYMQKDINDSVHPWCINLGYNFHLPNFNLLPAGVRHAVVTLYEG